ncbi:MAG: gliding motility-associated C-terminal domain-containing protein [Sphingobacteriales bacterium]|nr:MAG: gliding motility-associated C-terminal domain-containing protein [Sphingobacteriales bacterium]
MPIKKLLILFILFFFELHHADELQAQTAPAIQWQKSLGGSLNESADDIHSTADGGYIVGGTTQSSNGDVSGFHGTFDYWVVKLDALRNIQWQKCYGGSGDETLTSIKLTTDGGYILAGSSASVDGDISGHHGAANFNDIWIVKINSVGTIEWEKSLGGSRFERSPTIITTSDGGYIITGEADSNDGDVSGHHGASDIWVVKLASSGNIQWQRCYGGTDFEMGNDIKQTSDGGYIFTGHTYSNNMDVSGNHGSYPSFDAWVVKITSTGNIQWQKCYGGTGRDYPHAILQTSDGGYIVAGFSSSNDGDVSGNHSTDPVSDTWVFKFTATGNIQWQKCFGGTDTDFGLSISSTTDGGFVLSGATFSTDGDITNTNGGVVDVWVIKLNNSGFLEWQKCYGGTGGESAISIKPTPDGRYLFAGYSSSNNGDVSGNHGGLDFWIAKLGPAPCIPTIAVSAINTTVCKGDNVSFSSTITNGGSNPTYQWFVNSIPAGTNSNQFSTSLLANSDTVKCILISNAACASQPQAISNIIVMTVLDSTLPTIQINTSANSICAGTVISFTAAITNGGSAPVYQWLINGNVAGSNSANFSTGSLNNNDVVSCRLTSNAPCISSNAISSNLLPITVNPSPLGSVSPGSSRVCEGNVVTLTATGGSSYQWQLNGNNIPGALSPTYIATQSGNYSALISNGICSSKSINNSVVSILQKEAGIRYNSIRVAANLPYNLQARQIGSSYTWSPSTGLSNPSVSNPILTSNTDATYFITISSASLCPVTDTLTVQVFDRPGVYVPNGFTPNKDGLNDHLSPIAIHIKEIKSFQVFNRWGELVFSTNKIGEGWDGIYKGSLQPQGVYVWLFEGVDSKGNFIKEKGTSLLLR